MKIAGKIFAATILLLSVAASALCEIIPFANGAFALDIQSDDVYLTKDTEGLSDGEKEIFDHNEELEAIFLAGEKVVIVRYYSRDTNDYTDKSKAYKISICLLFGSLSNSDFLNSPITIYPTQDGFFTSQANEENGETSYYENLYIVLKHGIIELSGIDEGDSTTVAEKMFDLSGRINVQSSNSFVPN